MIGHQVLVRLHKSDFQVVTNVVLTLEPSQCNLAAVGKLVAQQVGFEVILFDSKPFHCFQVMLLVVLSFGKAHEEYWQNQKCYRRNAQDLMQT